MERLFEKCAMRRRGAVAAAIALVFAGASPLAVAAVATPSGPARAYVVRAASPSAAAAAVTRAGGRVDVALEVVNGVAAHLDAAELAALQREAGVSAMPDVPVHLTGEGFDATDPSAPASPAQDMQFAALNPPAGWTPSAGDGVSVALIDTGVADVPGLQGAHIVRGPDLSGEGDNVDHYGHGTFMAGLIVGQPGDGADAAHHGVAPGATLVPVKVAGASGDTTLSKVIAGIGWVVVHKDELNVRVMSLSFGADLPMAPEGNPLDAAVEAAWASGITVVAAAGNDGAQGVTSPGDDPWVITVGGTDTHGTVTTADDTVADWSGRSARDGKPDLLAPGTSVVSLRAPGSTVDSDFPSARIGDGYFRGSGTSMSTALIAGGVAVLAQDHPLATPDDLKGALTSVGSPLDGSPGTTADLAAADVVQPAPSWWQHHHLAFGGLGNGVDSDGMPWSAARWSGDTWNAARWSAARWSAARWSAARWSAARWSDETWGAARWSAARWSDAAWSAARWSAARWSAARWG